MAAKAKAKRRTWTGKPTQRRRPPPKPVGAELTERWIKFWSGK